MPAFLAKAAILLAPAAAGLGCGGESGPTEPAVLTTVEVTPAAERLFTVAPGNSVTLTVTARDQHGQVMANVGPPEFSSDDPAVATVANDGAVTAVGVGAALITASVTAGEITQSGTAAVTVAVAPSSAMVDAPALVFQPLVADVSLGGTVTWNIGAIHHTVTFSTPNAPENIPESQSVSVARSFPTQGTYAYRCLIHPQMTGSVRVH